MVLFKKRDGLYHIKHEDLMTLMLYAIPICFICARLYYVLFEWQYFAKHPLEILNIKQGRFSNLRRNHRWHHHMLPILQKKKNRLFRFIRLYCTSISTSGKQLAGGEIL